MLQEKIMICIWYIINSNKYANNLLFGELSLFSYKISATIILKIYTKDTE